ncbi:MAG: hypothetical protein ACPGVH_06180 [Chitinophagales bacterium]
MNKHIFSIVIMTSVVISLLSQEENTLYLFNGKSIEIETLAESSGAYLNVNDEEINKNDIKLIYFDNKLIGNLKGQHRLIYNHHLTESESKGKVNLFQAYTKTVTSNGGGTIGGKGTLQFFNVGTGNIQKANFKNLKPILSSNTESFEFLQKANTNNIMGKVFNYGGFGLALTGIAVVLVGATGGNGVKIPVLVTGGALFATGFTMVFTSSVFSKPKYKNTRLAIETFNE